METARTLRPTPFDVIAKLYVRFGESQHATRRVLYAHKFRWGKVYAKQKNLEAALDYYNKAQMEFSTKVVFFVRLVTLASHTEPLRKPSV